MSNPNKLLLDHIKEHSECISVHTSDGTKIGKIPHLFLFSFEYFSNMLSMNFFKSSDTNYEFILLIDYTTEMAEFFCKIILQMYYDELNLRDKELVWFFKICADYCLDQSLIDNNLKNIGGLRLNWAVFNEIVKLNSSKSFKDFPELPISKIFQRTKDSLLWGAITNPISTILEIPSESYTRPLGRNFICEILEKCECDNETDLFSTLVEKIILINSEATKLSLKAVYDLLSKIRWFFVRQDLFSKIWNRLTEMYPLIVLTKQINFAFKSRTGPITELDTIHYYGDNFKEFPPRSGLEYEKVFPYESHMEVYTTTKKTPIVITFKFGRKEKKRSPAYIEIVCTSDRNNFPGSLVAVFDVILLDNNDNILFTKNKIWTFHNYFQLKLDDDENQCSKYKIQFSKIYFIEPDDKFISKKSKVIVDSDSDCGF